MALVNCPECGKNVSDSAAACPECGYAVSMHFQKEKLEQKKQRKKEVIRKNKLFKIAVVTILPIMVVAGGGIMGYEKIYVPNIEKNVTIASNAYYKEESEFDECIQMVEKSILFVKKEVRYDRAKKLVRDRLVAYAGDFVGIQEYEKAYELLNRVSKDFGNDNEIAKVKNYAHGMISYEMGNYETAVKIFENGNYTGEEYLESCYIMANNYIEWKSLAGYRLAIKFLEKIVVYDYKDSKEILETLKEYFG